MSTAATRRRPLGLARLGIVLAVVVALAATLFQGVTGLPGASPPAQAATRGHALEIGGLIVGNLLSSDGRTYVYCVEPGGSNPTGAQSTPVRTGTLPGYRNDSGDPWTDWEGRVGDGAVQGETVRQMNYVMWVHGRTTNAEQAAAVQFAVWMLRRTSGTSAWLDHQIARVRQHGRGDIIDRANVLVAEARREAVVPIVESGSLAITSSYRADEDGRITAGGRVDYPESTSELRMDGGTFENGTTRHRISDGSSGGAPWTADLHPERWQRFADVSISAKWSRETVSWPMEVVLHPPVDTAQQTLGLGISPVVERQDRDLDPVEARFDTRFDPVLSTRVPSRFVQRGEAFGDRVDLGVAEGTTPWASRTGEDGEVEFAPVVAEGVLYGPFASPPAEAEAPPPGAPVAARARIEADDGPGRYPVTTSERADEAGYYSWVWTIRASEQPEEIRMAGLIAPDYAFTDRFGLAEEGQTVPTRLRWNTELLHREVFLDDMTLVDRATASLHEGAWLRGTDGKRVPATLRMTVFRSDERPERSREVPETAVEVATTRVVVQGHGEAVESEPIPLPFETRGWVTVRTCLVAEDQPETVRGLVEEWCDDYGVPSETARIRPPEVRTRAQAEGIVGDTIRDTAHVTGKVPEDSTIGFAFYLRPEAGDYKYDENWKVRRDALGEKLRWTERELAELGDDERCLVQPVATTERVPVPRAGEYESPEVQAVSEGVGFWVEDLVTLHPETGEPVELHRGKCGIADERTVVSRPGRPSPPEKSESPEPAARLPETGRVGSGAMAAIALGAIGIAFATVGLGRQIGRRRREQAAD